MLRELLFYVLNYGKIAVFIWAIGEIIINTYENSKI